MGCESYNIQVFKDTRKLSLEDYADETKALIERTKVYEAVSDISFEEPVKQEIEFRNTRTITAGIEGVERGYHVAILNFADGCQAGGLVLQGEGTQEESICRCSNLYESLLKDECKQKYYNKNIKAGLVFTDTIIYSPDVLVFKDSDYWFLNKPIKLDVITCPAPIGSVATLEILVRRVECILKAAVDNNVDYLVLGAWGCGAFGNAVEMVAEAFKEVINKMPYFKKIVFAIASSEGDNDDCFEMFKEAYESEG